jgi:hypothetical protein
MVSVRHEGTVKGRVRRAAGGGLLRTAKRRIRLHRAILLRPASSQRLAASIRLIRPIRPILAGHSPGSPADRESSKQGSLLVNLAYFCGWISRISTKSVDIPPPATRALLAHFAHFDGKSSQVPLYQRLTTENRAFSVKPSQTQSN